MVDLETNYMGLQLAHPIIASASPLTKTIEGIKKLESSGVAAVVLPSLFEEQILQEQHALDLQLQTTANSSAEAAYYFTDANQFQKISDQYLQLIDQAVTQTSIPVIASLNGMTESGWTDFAVQIEAAGASALELNIYSLPTDFNRNALSVEGHCMAILQAVRQTVSIPIAVKISPYYSALGNLVKQFDTNGANALVLFNRFYQADIDIESRQVVSNLILSNETEVRLPLTWIGLLYQKLNLSLAATSGVVSFREVVKYILAGADVVMTTSALLRNGPDFVKVLRHGLQDWMIRNGYQSINELRGSMSLSNVADPENYERVQYMKVLSEYQLP